MEYVCKAFFLLSSITSSVIGVLKHLSTALANDSGDSTSYSKVWAKVDAQRVPGISEYTAGHPQYIASSSELEKPSDRLADRKMSVSL